jgi:hypothetical protein
MKMEARKFQLVVVRMGCKLLVGGLVVLVRKERDGFIEENLGVIHG